MRVCFTHCPLGMLGLQSSFHSYPLHTFHLQDFIHALLRPLPRTRKLNTCRKNILLTKKPCFQECRKLVLKDVVTDNYRQCKQAMCFKNNHDKAHMEIFLNLPSCCKIRRIMEWAFLDQLIMPKISDKWTTVEAWFDWFIVFVFYWLKSVFKQFIWLKFPNKTPFHPFFVTVDQYYVILHPFSRWNTERNTQPTQSKENGSQ